MFPPESGCPRTVGCMRFEASIDVAAPAQLLFEVYTDVERWPEWTASVTSVERLDQGPLSVGSRARIKQPRLPAAVWEVTEVVAGHSFTWMARGPGIITTGSHVVPRQRVGARSESPHHWNRPGCSVRCSVS
jgi:uncharacterized membrane protein